MALRVLIERKWEFRQKLFSVDVDLCKAFDSTRREALWKILKIRGVLPELFGLISALYSRTERTARCGGNI